MTDGTKEKTEEGLPLTTSPAGRGHSCHFLIRVFIFCSNPASTRFKRGLTNVTDRLNQTHATDQQRPDRINNLQRKGRMERGHVSRSANGKKGMRSRGDPRVRERECEKRAWWCYLNHCFWWNKTLSPQKPKPLAAARPVVFSSLSLSLSLSLYFSFPLSILLLLGFSQLFDSGLKPLLSIQIPI
ncbi:hypothetical protein VNO78_10891 [Psophocarpus tetragonolobus]|uniref:Uncharacterized protein n=1 Tax=Psophocarpus tetragonolobus TaxID=3891 RepID=A0AAN9SKU2_PSOTE